MSSGGHSHSHSHSTPPNSSSNLLHQFLVTDSIPSQNQFHPHFLNARQPPPFGQVPTIQSLGERMSRSLDLIQQSDTQSHSMSPYGSEMLSLSLSSEMLFRPIQLRQPPFSSYLPSSVEQEVKEAEYYSFPPSSSSSSSDNNNNNNNSYGVDSFAIDVISNSRYLKPTQSLLQEVVCVGGETVQSSNERYFNKMSCKSRRGSLSFYSELKSNTLQNDSDGFQTLGKLVALLQEVERRYEQYNKDLEKVVSSLEMVAGIGAGKSYTALALQAMSRHFCSLRDAITSQIIETRRKIRAGDHGCGRDNRGMMSLQQLAMAQSQRQAWRPIRGLPEVSVSILRCWLFEHFLHPYPNDNEKLTLSSQTGLTRNQVSNWFINARVRLWKPMIEEMYRKELDEDCPDISNPLTFNIQGITEHEDE